jgi:hypothetical protein
MVAFLMRKTNGVLPKADYDYEAARKAGVKPDERGHLPDTYKLPNHITFSTDSKYSTPERPGGVWRNYGKPGKKEVWTYTPSWFVLQQHSPAELKKYFRENEPDAILVFPPGAER